jgi:hypothetical protein
MLGIADQIRALNEAQLNERKVRVEHTFAGFPAAAGNDSRVDDRPRAAAGRDSASGASYPGPGSGAVRTLSRDSAAIGELHDEVG